MLQKNNRIGSHQECMGEEPHRQYYQPPVEKAGWPKMTLRSPAVRGGKPNSEPILQVKIAHQTNEMDNVLQKPPECSGIIAVSCGTFDNGIALIL
ncbi:hypothetical protein CEXT_249401 [Caerostris extrusa]|uniref:Uncharacterized protein n=1 Tax=Caerostris extrusa TaxID=172846 RepID=A0AAV4QHP5_CAEEX|nr:hypothetical protein CEXT_249401 [Caerostris extrusa]